MFASTFQSLFDFNDRENVRGIQKLKQQKSKKANNFFQNLIRQQGLDKTGAE